MTFVPAAIGISFQSALSWIWVLLAAIFTAGVLTWLYRRLFQLYPKRQALTLLLLKLAAVIVLLLGLLRPALYSEQKDLANARIVVLVDDSRSMSTRDGSIGQPRIDEARRIVFDSLLPKVGDRLMVSTMAFSNRLKTIEKPDQLAGNGDSTDIPNAILEAQRNLKAGSIGAYVIVSDGGDAQALPQGFSAGAPVFAVSVGTDLSNADDLRIGEVQHPERVDSKTEFEVKAEVAVTGHDDFIDKLPALSLELTEGKNQISAQPVKFTRAAKKLQLNYRVPAPDPGIHRYTLKLPVQNSEVATLNNERNFTVEVQDPSLRVLYYASKLGQSYKPLRNALKTDPGIHITGLVRVGSDRFLLQGEKPDDKLKNEFPASEELLKKFKCVILSDAQASDLSPASIAALEQYILNGGGVVFLGGAQSYGLGGWTSTPLAPAFPWQITPNEPAYKNETIAIELSPLGRAHPIFRDLGAALGANGPSAKMSGYNSPGLLRPGAQAFVSGILPSGEHPSVVAFSRYGKGRVLAIASHALWLWNDSDAEGGKTYSAFWRQAIRFMAGSDDGGGLLNLNADRNGHYTAGSQAIVTARVLDRTLTPLKGAVLNGTLKKLDGTVVGIVNFREDGPPGLYSASVDLAFADTYRLQVSASDSKGVLETRELMLEAGGGSGEGAFPAVNTSYLQELATRSGGLLLPQDKADELAGKLVAGVKAEVRRKEISLLWDNPVYFLIFLSLMSSEWIARRRMNMI